MAYQKKVLEDLTRIKRFISQLQNLLLSGCKQDLDDILERGEFDILGPVGIGENSESYRDTVAHEALREQVEIETYVPLRSVISRLLVHGWRYDDMELQFKIQCIKARPQIFANIDSAHQSPSDWKTVSDIITKEVGMTTLPCNKLRAIVDAAKEISRLSKEERTNVKHKRHNFIEKEELSGESSSLGADDFLPIFIMCLARAKIKRPCALCVLLLNLCDPSKQIGEVGYYLSSFEAAIIYILELELRNDK